MENVKGLLSSTLAGERIVERILKDLASPSSAIRVGTGHRYVLVPLAMPSTDLFGDVHDP
jgi:DNA (cytosine-5)-methyltransferase 1